MTRQINDAGLALIKHAEGCELEAYPDPGTGGAPWTVGYGHTGPGVQKNLVITQAEADAYLVADLAKFCAAVEHYAPVCTDNQFAALVSFAFNEGASKLATSTLLHLHNAGDYQGAQKQFQLWTYASGHKLPGLIARRAAEAALYGTPDHG